MPLIPGASPSKTIPELHTGQTYSHTKAKFGKERADRQAIAIALSNARETKGRAFGGPMMGNMGMPNNVLGGMMAQASNPVMSAGIAPPTGTITPNGSAMPMQSAMVGAHDMPNHAMDGRAGVLPTPSPISMPAGAINPLSPVPQGIGGAPNMGMVNPAVPTPPVMRKDGGIVKKRAFGGAGLVKTPTMNPTWQERNEARSMTRGPILSSVPGRTDAHFTHVPSGSFVIPADIVSAHGEGNTIAGAGALSKMFKMGPYGAGMPKMGGRSSMPRPPTLGKMMSGGGKGGTDKHVGTPVPVKLAGGEIVVPPENLMQVVHPNLKTAHEIMDKWVVLERKKLRKTLAKLPPPAKD